MDAREAEDLFARGIESVDVGDTTYGLVCLEKCAPRYHDNPLFRSYLAVCLARERGQHAEGAAMCRKAIAEDPRSSVHYLNLGRILVFAGKKREAIRTFRDGLLYEKNELIQRELEMLGWRKIPIIRSLPREHPVNIALGKMAGKLRMR